MSDFDRDALFSDIDKIMEQQGFSNIGSSSMPVEIEATDEPESENMATIQPHELDMIERVVNPELAAKRVELELETQEELMEAQPLDDQQINVGQTFPEPVAASAPTVNDAEEESMEPDVVSLSLEKPVSPNYEDMVEPEVNLTRSEPVSPDKFTTIEKPMEWSLGSESKSGEEQKSENYVPPVSYLEEASSDGIQVENVAFGDISVGVETESVEFSVGHPFIRLFRNILIVVALALVISLFITKFIASHTSVDGSSMSPTLTSGDQLIVEKFSYYFHDPERFDIVVFPISTEDDYIKRVIGLPGETVQIVNGQVYINGNLLTDDRYGAEIIEDPGTAADTIFLQPDEYFVLGDNRNASVDSRFPEVGLIHKKDIEGRAWLRFYPFGSFGLVN